MAFNRFAAGNKQYGLAGSRRPTAGPVNPSGYIQRELARRSNQQGVSKVGRDGQSDTRSGLAHNAIKNNLGNNIGRGPAAPNPPRSPNAPKAKSNLPSFGMTRNGQQQAINPAAAVRPQAAAAPPATPVTASGQLQIPYDSEYYDQVLNAQQNFDAEMMGIGFEEQDHALALQQFIRELEEGYVDRKRGTLNNAGASGMLQSSLHSTGINEDAREYTQAKTDSEMEDVNRRNQWATRKTGAQNFFNQNVQRAYGSLAERYAYQQAQAQAQAQAEAEAEAQLENWRINDPDAYYAGYYTDGNPIPRPQWGVAPATVPQANIANTRIKNNLGNNIGRGQVGSGGGNKNNNGGNKNNNGGKKGKK